jgi:transcriptional regulator with XRE-family HTH domain
MSDSGQSVKEPGRNRTLTQDPRKLRNRRINAGLSLTDLAEQAGVSKSYLSELEAGIYSASAPLLADLARALKRRITDLRTADAA